MVEIIEFVTLFVAQLLTRKFGGKRSSCIYGYCSGYGTMCAVRAHIIFEALYCSIVLLFLSYFARTQICVRDVCCEICKVIKALQVVEVLSSVSTLVHFLTVGILLLFNVQ